MKIEKDKVVSLTYDLHSNVKGSEERNHVESTGSDHPMTFLFGSGNLIPEFENNLLNKSKGDHFEFSILAENAYGEFDPEALVNLPIDIFKVDGIVDLKMLQTGNIIPLSDEEGNRMNGKIIKIDGENVQIDFNHPLAGHILHFKGKIVEVRLATADELAHGHVHTGEGGH
jgi:FKBP-type peptidyl-prolyl cis-trans isomerase SlyD